MAAVAGIEEVANPLGEAVVTSAMRREANSQALAASAAGLFSMRAMAPRKPYSVFVAGRIVLVIVDLRSSV